MNQKLDPVDHLFIGPLYPTPSSENRAEVDTLLGIKPGHRDSNQIVTGYCNADSKIRTRIEQLLGFDAEGVGGGDVNRG